MCPLQGPQAGRGCIEDNGQQLEHGPRLVAWPLPLPLTGMFELCDERGKPQSRFHADRVTGGDCDHCHTRSDTLPGVCQGAGEGAADQLPEQHQADRAGKARDVRACDCKGEMRMSEKSMEIAACVMSVWTIAAFLVGFRAGACRSKRGSGTLDSVPGPDGIEPWRHGGNNPQPPKRVNPPVPSWRYGTTMPPPPDDPKRNATIEVL